MRAIDDDTPMKVAVLRTLQAWGTLPESDLSRMVRDYLVVTDDLRDMAEEGLIEMRFAGDEYILSTTQLGGYFLDQHGAAS